MQKVHEQILSYRWNDNACFNCSECLGGVL